MNVLILIIVGILALATIFEMINCVKGIKKVIREL